MATRCTIKVEGVDFCKIYKHWDGYPDEMLKPLRKFNRNFEKNRPGDPMYKFAQLLRATPKLFDTGEEFTGWGIMEYSDSWGEEYEYTLMLNGKVEVIII